MRSLRGVPRIVLADASAAMTRYAAAANNATRAKRDVPCETVGPRCEPPPEPGFARREAWCGLLATTAKKGALGGNMVSPELAGTVVGTHERIPVVGRRHERLLDGARADPPDQVPHRARLVVRTGGARAAERLLSDDRAGRLVVHVEVAGGVAELLAGLLDRRPLLCEDGAREAVRRTAVDDLERLGPLALGVDVRGHHRTEELVAEEAEVGIGGLDHGRLDEVALGVVGAAADEDLRAIPLRLRDRLLLRAEGARVDDGAHEVPEVGWVAHPDRADLLDEPVAQLGPEVRGREDARGGRAFLALVLERAADDRGRDRLHVRGWVRDDEVLAPGLADDARVVPVPVDVRADLLPHRVEDSSRAGEVDAREVRARERGVADRRARAVDQVDHARRK